MRFKETAVADQETQPAARKAAFFAHCYLVLATFLANKLPKATFVPGWRGIVQIDC